MLFESFCCQKSIYLNVSKLTCSCPNLAACSRVQFLYFHWEECLHQVQKLLLSAVTNINNKMHTIFNDLMGAFSSKSRCPFLESKAAPFKCCKGNRKQSKGKVLCLEMSSLWRYKENYVARNASAKFRDFWETGPRLRVG